MGSSVESWKLIIIFWEEIILKVEYCSFKYETFIIEPQYLQTKRSANNPIDKGTIQ